MQHDKKYIFGIGVMENVLECEKSLTVSDHIRLIGEVGWGAFFTGWAHDRIEAWAEAGARCGLVYQSIHSPFNKVNLMWQEGEEGRAVTQMLIDCAADCARFDIPVMVIHPFIGFKDHTPTDVGLDNFGRIIEAADKMGVKLGFENVEGAEYLAAIMQKYGDVPSVGFCYDTGHEHCYNDGRDQMLLYGDKLCHTHFNDNFGMATEEITWHDDLHLPMGDGIVDWGRVMDRIDASPYEGVLMAELTRRNKPDKHTHDAYAAIPIDDFYALALGRMRRVVDRTIGGHPKHAEMPQA